MHHPLNENIKVLESVQTHMGKIHIIASGPRNKQPVTVETQVVLCFLKDPTVLVVWNLRHRYSDWSDLDTGHYIVKSDDETYSDWFNRAMKAFISRLSEHLPYMMSCWREQDMEEKNVKY